MLLPLLGDGTQVPVAELPGAGPWTFLVLHPDPGPADPDPVAARGGFLARFGRAVVPDLRERPGWGAPAGDRGSSTWWTTWTRYGHGPGSAGPCSWAWATSPGGPAGRGRPALGLAGAAARPTRRRTARRRSRSGGPGAAGLDRLDLPVLVLDPDPASAGRRRRWRGC